ncbi:PREDICTED: aquaporin AQPcic-like isoform X1 [Polistes dominula]|uniref:Aquaporin AQPcic-like isoform X1 n=2 Tax=Polistes dominula TaxID=743375 RepID=A0ABM1IZ58_POLDO|nr:PREDICTED: aquaporin AQPcic-like isoform X1 [Polistes dominula]
MASNNLRTGFKKLVQEEGAMKKIVITGLAEMLGTSILVFLGCMGCVGSLGVIPSHLQITLNFGLSVMIVIQCFGHISDAHVNPAITVGSVVLGKKTIPEAMVYFLAQVLGSIMGYGMLKVVTPTEFLKVGNVDDADNVCVTFINPNISAIQGLLLEGISTFVLMLVACAVWDIRNKMNTDSVALKFGFTVAALATAVGPYTGCSMNPVRSLGPAIWNNQWSHHWIYWFGPIGGALFSSISYRTIFGVQNSDEEEITPESVALNSADIPMKLEVREQP